MRNLEAEIEHVSDVEPRRGAEETIARADLALAARGAGELECTGCTQAEGAVLAVDATAHGPVGEVVETRHVLVVDDEPPVAATSSRLGDRASERAVRCRRVEAD